MYKTVKWAKISFVALSRWTTFNATVFIKLNFSHQSGGKEKCLEITLPASNSESQSYDKLGIKFHQPFQKIQFIFELIFEFRIEFPWFYFLQNAFAFNFLQLAHLTLLLETQN